MIWNAPNIITVVRLVVAFLFIPTYFYEEANGIGHTISLSLYVFASVTDVIDGYIARKYSLITEFGKIFDPVADKLLQFIVAACIAFFDPIFIYLAALIFVKEISMAIGAYKLYRDKVVVSANIYGKMASVVYFLLFFIIIGFRDNISDTIKYVMLTLITIATITAFINYFIEYFKIKGKK